MFTLRDEDVKWSHYIVEWNQQLILIGVVVPTQEYVLSEVMYLLGIATNNKRWWATKTAIAHPQKKPYAN